jgi:hypothetical protein
MTETLQVYSPLYLHSLSPINDTDHHVNEIIKNVIFNAKNSQYEYKYMIYNTNVNMYDYNPAYWKSWFVYKPSKYKSISIEEFNHRIGMNIFEKTNFVMQLVKSRFTSDVNISCEFVFQHNEDYIDLEMAEEKIRTIKTTKLKITNTTEDNFLIHDIIKNYPRYNELSIYILVVYL